MRRIPVLAASVLLSGALLAGCGDDTESNTQAYCDALATAQSDIAELKTLAQGDATVDEIRDQSQQIQDDLATLRDKRADLGSSVAEEADQYFQDFEDAVSSIPGDATLSEAATQYADAARQLEADLAALSTDIQC